MQRGLVGSEMCIRDRVSTQSTWGQIMIQDISAIMFDERQIHARIKELGEQISKDYCGKTPVLLCILKGASMFMADLMRAITIPVEIDFMAISSYGDSRKSSGVVPVSYTHLTLPTILLVQISVVAVSLKKKIQQN
eukprot:TRINITY_DN11314_c0_g1_i1.p1 TRINITY_DN11314_c0_g1~~TRINITY_DN11314_c0_g1_i1.p1  ORF type:complete len:136 (-),score=37.70 TRINITY_DN11314_c0_g1_i1:90-497(-)